MSVICHTVTRGCFWSFCTDQWSLYVNCKFASFTFFFAFFLQEKKKTSPCLPQSSSAHHQPQVVEVVKIPGNQSVKYKSLSTELPKCQISNYEKPCVAHKLHCLPHSSTLRDGGGDLKSGKQLEEICARSQISFCFNPWQSMTIHDKAVLLEWWKKEWKKDNSRKRGCASTSTDPQPWLAPNISPCSSLSCSRTRRLWGKGKWTLKNCQCYSATSLLWPSQCYLSTVLPCYFVTWILCYLRTLTSQQMTTSSSCPSVSLRLTIFTRKAMYWSSIYCEGLLGEFLFYLMLS